MKVFVTGAAGQIGSHVVEMSLAEGHDVVGIDNFATGRQAHLANDAAFHFIEGSIADKALVDSVVSDAKPDVVVHTAGSYKDPNDWYNDTLTNCVGGTNIIKASMNNNVGRFIYFQTALCYGTNPMENPITLNHPKYPGNSSYAISKTAAEDYLELSGIDYVIFRLANVIGPRNVSGPLPIFYQRLKEGKGCFVTKTRRDFVFVKDLVRTVMKAVHGEGQGIYHFSSGKDVSIKELYDTVVDAMRLNDYPEPEIREPGPDDPYSILLDPSGLGGDFGNVDFTPLEQIVRETVDYFEEYGVHGGYTHLDMKKTEK